MAHRFVIDTHALVWFLENNPRLGSQADAVLQDPRSSLVLPLIALAEGFWLVEHGRSSIPTGNHLLSEVDGDPRIAIAELRRPIFDRSLMLTSIPELHDRFIVATALELADQGDNVSLLTRDSTMHNSNLVPVVW